MAAALPAKAHMASSKTASPGTLLIAIHDFAARSPDEITLHKGDKVELVEKDEEFGACFLQLFAPTKILTPIASSPGDGWFLGRLLSSGATGLFPEGEPCPKMSSSHPDTHTPASLHECRAEPKHEACCSKARSACVHRGILQHPVFANDCRT